MLIITQAPCTAGDPDYFAGASWRVLPKAQIAALDPGKYGKSKVLTDEFHSACYPEISYDGKSMIFAAQKKEGDLWQIWEMDLRSLKSRKVISLGEDCFDPAYLPGGRMVFTRLTRNDTVKSAYCLYTCDLDGSALRQVTFSPQSCFATTVLKDGRLLTVSRQLLPGQETPMFMVLRPDGTKADMFYEGDEGTSLISRGRETTDGKIVFIEAEKGSPSKQHAISINYSRPLHSRINLIPGPEGAFNSVLPLSPGSLLLSYRMPDSVNFALYEFDPAMKSPGKVIYANQELNILDAVVAEKYQKPKKLPSEVDMHVKTGLLLCQDINFMGFESTIHNPGIPKASMIEVLGIDSTYGVVPVEEDGSFYLKVLADTPFRIRTLDKDGRVLYGPCSWLWLRPNERRGCVGCHEDPELVPVNRIPLAVKTDPAIIPVHITRVKEKVVELE